ncbi:MAG: hypothetical protein RMK29_10905 [Myxococcales bacterium]|nr:hypothetical protein [Myxococcota bacterium]MDW8282214.1 hypothetical protein [Myxococcales bacterium]
MRTLLIILIIGLGLGGLLGCGPADLEDLVEDPLSGEQLDAAAARVDMHHLLRDADLTEGGHITVQQVQDFLQRKGGLLARYRDPEAGGRTAAEIIVEQGRAHRIHPVYLLARIQTESSLVSGHVPARLPRAAGCGCPDGAGCSSAYAGFARQVQCAAEKMRSYLRDLEAGRPTVSGWRPGVARSTLDPCRVVPANRATAALYTYTPWVGAYAVQCGRRSVGGSSLLAALYGTYRQDPVFR